MRVHSLCQSIFLLSALLLFVICSADDKTFQVVGTGHCRDCADSNFKPSEALSGLHVTIDCKLKNGDMKRVVAGTLNDKGEFALPLPQDIVDDGQHLKHDCYAQLHSAAAIPCPTHSKIAFKSLDNKGKLYTFAPRNNLQFSAALCTSKFLWPHFKFPPLPKTHPWLKNFGHPWTLPPLSPLPPLHKPLIFPPIYKHPIVKPLPPPVPVYQPPPVPVYKPPVVKPHPPPVPVYEPPVVKPHPPPVPVYKPPKKPCPPKPKPPVHKPPKKPCPPKSKPPVYKPPVVKPLPPPVPIYKPPIVKPPPPPVPIYKPPVVKPLPPPVPIYKPPLFKKPCPPLPPLPKLPPFPKIPPKSFFKHPKFGGWPPLPPAIPQP